MDILKRKINAIKTNIKEIPKENLFLIFLIAVFVLSLLSDLSVIPLPDFVIMNFGDKPSLSLALFSAQATLATVGIAVVSMITGMVNDYIYGVSISKYITSIRPKLFKQKGLIFFNLFSILINYFLVSYSMTNCSIAIFFISIATTALLMKNIFLVFNGRDSIRTEIEDYLIENHEKSDIERLGKEMLKAITSGNSLEFLSDQAVLTRLFEKEAEKSKQEKTECMYAILNTVSDILRKLSTQSNPIIEYEQIKNIIELYVISNLKEIAINILAHSEEDISNLISRLSFEKIRNGILLSFIRCEMKDNISFQLEESDIFIPKHLSCGFFHAIKSNKTLDTEEKKWIWKLIYKDIHDDIHSYSSLVPENIRKNIEYMDIQDICWLHKAMIDAGEGDAMIEQFYPELHLRAFNGDEKDFLIFLISEIYLYYIYISERENSSEREKREREYIISATRKESQESFQCYNWGIFTTDSYQFVRKILDLWECPTVVTENFFVFSALLFCEKSREQARAVSSSIGGRNVIFRIISDMGLFNSRYREFLSFFEESDKRELTSYSCNQIASFFGIGII